MEAKEALKKLKGDKYLTTMFPNELAALEAAIASKPPSFDVEKVQGLLTQVAATAAEAKALLGGGAAKASSKSPRAAKEPAIARVSSRPAAVEAATK